MREKSGPKSLYEKICRCLSTRFMALVAAGSFFLLMLPVFCLSFVNRASGDDYGYGVNTRAVWEATHSLFEVFQAAFHSASVLLQLAGNLVQYFLLFPSAGGL